MFEGNYPKQVSYYVNYKQAVLKYEEDEIKIDVYPANPIQGKMNTPIITEREKIEISTQALTLDQPLSLVQLYEANQDDDVRIPETYIDFLEEYLRDILTRDYPNTKQQNNFNTLAELPHLAQTQAILKYCHKVKIGHGCICPLAFSIGCIDLCEKEIAPERGKVNKRTVYAHHPDSIKRKDAFRMLMGTFRNLTSWKRVKKMIQSVKDRVEFDEEIVKAFENSTDYDTSGPNRQGRQTNGQEEMTSI